MPQVSPRLLIVAATTGYQTRVFEEAARGLGFEAVLATDRCHVLDNPWGDHAVPLKFDRPEAAAKALRKHAAGPFDGIVAVGDRPAYVASMLAAELGLRFSPPEAVAACKNKFLARQRFFAAGLPTPRFFRIEAAADPRESASQAFYPCVLKPTGLSVSRGVIRANHPVEFVAAFERIRALLDLPEIRKQRDAEDRFIQVEEYIEGREFALEGILEQGRFHPIALFDKPDPLEGPFFEETLYLTPSRLSGEEQRAILDASVQAIAALGLTDGPVHAEMRLNRHGVWMLEVANRPIGGLCARALRFEPDQPYEQILLKAACGLNWRADRLRGGASGVYMLPVRRDGIFTGWDGEQEARAVPGIEDVVLTAKEGQQLKPLPEGASYLGFLFAHAATPDQVEWALRAAERKLIVNTNLSLPVVR